jgi:hypothetical protein
MANEDDAWLHNVSVEVATIITAQRG